MNSKATELLSVIDVLYEGMLDDTAWQRALVKLTDFVSGSAVALFSLNPSTNKVYRADVAGLDPKVMREYQDTWIYHDPRHASALTCAIGEPQVEGMLVRPRDFNRSPIFNEFFKPADIPHLLATWVERSPTRGVVLSVQGSSARGAFTEDERRRMAVLIPHVRRIVEMKDRMACAQTSAAGMLETMDHLPFGLILLAKNWEIVEASAIAQTLLARRAGIHADGARLGFVRNADERAFAECLNEDPNRARLNDAILVARPDSLQPLSLLVLPLKPGQEHWVRPAARWLVLVFDPEASLPLPERNLRQALGITAAEAALARRLASGMSVTEAAGDLGVSLNTVRTQLKSIFAKTGVNSQAQLIRRILSGPATFS